MIHKVRIQNFKALRDMSVVLLSPEQVRIMAVGADGYDRCGRLTDHPKFPTWKDEMAPGEMWSLFGEKWLVEQGATA